MNARADGQKRAVRVILADATPKVRSALKLLLEQDDETRVNTSVASARGLLEQVRLSCPDAILLDCDLSGLEVGEVLPQLRSLCPRVRVIALCSRPEMRQAALSAGVDAFVAKDESPEKLLEVLRDGQRRHHSAGDHDESKGQQVVSPPRTDNAMKPSKGK